MAVQLFANAIIRLALLLIGEVVDPPQFVDLIGSELLDGVNVPPPKGLCRMTLFGLQTEEPAIPGAPLQQCSVMVYCDDTTTKFYEFMNATWDGCKLESTHHVSDPHIGDFDIYFRTPTPAQRPSAFPFPGLPILISDRYKLSRDDGMPLQECINLQRAHDYFESKDCHGNDVQAKVCEDGFADLKPGVIKPEEVRKRGWMYHVAFPRIDIPVPACE